MSDNAKFALTPAHALLAPDIEVNARATFDIDIDMVVPAFSKGSDYVPVLDANYQFDTDTTLAILAGFAHNRRVMIQGYHGTNPHRTSHVRQTGPAFAVPTVISAALT